MDSIFTYLQTADKWKNWTICKYMYISCDVSLLRNPLQKV